MQPVSSLAPKQNAMNISSRSPPASSHRAVSVADRKRLIVHEPPEAFQPHSVMPSGFHNRTRGEPCCPP